MHTRNCPMIKEIYYMNIMKEELFRKSVKQKQEFNLQQNFWGHP
jgi:hypothetical protein